MHKLTCLIIFTVVLIPCTGFTIPVGNPMHYADYGSFMLSGEYFILSRPGKGKSSSSQRYTFKDIGIISKISYGVTNRLNISLRLGTVENKIESKNITPKRIMDSDFDFMWGVEEKGMLYDFRNGVTLHELVSVIGHNNHVYQITGVTGVPRSNGNIYEWQGALILAGNFGDFTFYGGGKYSDYVTSFSNNTNIEDINAENNWGIFIGTDVHLNDKFSVGLEGRFIDETAFATGLTYHF